MWATTQGDRTLIGPESVLVRKSVDYLRDMITVGIDLNEPYQTEVEIFSELQPTQQLTILHEVAFALLDPDCPTPELNAIREGTVYALYREIVSLVEIEIDLSQFESTPDYDIRTSVVSAFEQFDHFPEQWVCEFTPDILELGRPTKQCVDLEEWSRVIEFLADQVLWDRDFEFETMIVDGDPGKIDSIKNYLGIAQDYYAVPAPDVHSEDYQRIDGELIALIALTAEIQIDDDRS